MKELWRRSDFKEGTKTMVINTNYSALSSGRQLGESQGMLNKSLARLSSGSKLVNPSDDAAGFAVSARFDAQINRTQAAVDNIGNAVSFSQTQDGYLKKVAKALDRMSELSLLALDETKSDTDRGLYNNEFTKLGAFVTASSTRDFNGVSMFGSSAINQLATDRATVGANQAALNMYQEQLGVSKDNLTAANSRIKDVNVADESTTFAKYNILVQAGTAMLAQANASPQSALRLLG